MKFLIDNLQVLRADIDAASSQSSSAIYHFLKSELPKVDWIPAIQRRRLSPFIKMFLHCAYNAGKGSAELPAVFSSRHGDMHKTSGLLNSLAENEALSPTAFSLSVHNAAAGLLNIFMENTSASTTISAGKNSFFMGVIDAYIKLKTGKYDEILMVHCDQVLPSEYLRFQDEKQVDHSVAFIMRLPTTERKFSATLVDIQQFPNDSQADNFPLSLLFSDWLTSDKQSAVFFGKGASWKGSKAVEKV